MQTNRIAKMKYLYYNINANTYELFWFVCRVLAFFLEALCQRAKDI